MTPLERLVRQHVEKRTSWSAGIEPLAEQITKDLLADESFRASVKALIQAQLGGRPEGLDLFREECRWRRRESLAYVCMAIAVLSIVVAALVVIFRG